jgi:predicted RNA binding protein YcfA (HicA-like mRNA interferase family)
LTPHRLDRLTAGQVMDILERHDFSLVSQRGSHRKFRNALMHRQVIVPVHQGRVLPIGTLESIIRGSGISRDEF